VINTIIGVKQNNRQNALGFLFVATFNLIFALPLYLSTVPVVVDGFVPFPLINGSQKPYTDYFWPAPPLTIWKAHFCNLFPDPLLVWHLIGIGYVLIFALSVYVICRQFSGIFASVLGSIFASALNLSYPLERSGGWNQGYFAYLWAATAFMCLLMRDQHNASRGKSSLYWISVGVFSALSILEKQTAFLSIAMLFIGVFIYLQRRPFEENQRNLKTNFKYSIGVLLGLGSLTLLWLSLNGSITNAINDIAKGGGKQVGIVDTVSTILSDFERIVSQPVCWLIVSVLVLKKQKHFLLNSESASFARFSKNSVNLVTAGAFFFFLSTYDLATHFALVSALVLYLGLQLNYWESAKMQMFGSVLLVLAIFSCVVAILAKSSKPGFARVVSLTPSDALLVCSAVMGVFFLLYQLNSAKYLSGITGLSLLIVIPLSGPPTAWVFTGVLGVLIATAVQQAAPLFQKSWKTIGICSGVALCSLALLIQAFLVPFSWWGWHEPSFSLERNTPSIRYLRNFRLHPNVANFYQELSRMVDVATAKSSGKTILSYPNIPIAVNLSSLQSVNMRCPILFWDLCPDDYALQSLEQLKVQYPDVVVWLRPSDMAVQSHESRYRNGEEAALRDWTNWLSEQVDSGKLVKVGSVWTPGTQPFSNWPVEVYFHEKN
jgi:hypothetical protein